MALEELHVLTNGQVLTPAGPRPATVAWRGDRVVDVLPAPLPEWAGAQVDDVSGCLILPGLIDPHVHSREPGMEEKETFATMTAGALKGGVTTVFEMPNSRPPLLRSAQVAERTAYFQSRSQVNFGLWGLALGDDRFDDIAGVLEAGAVGVKAFYGYRYDVAAGRFLYTTGPAGSSDDGEVLSPLDEPRLRHIASQVAECNGVLAVHCEDPRLLGGGAQAPAAPKVASHYRRLLEERPAAAEDAAVATVVQLAEETGCAMHVVHLASAGAIPLIAEAKSRGLRVTAETAPHYWLTSAEAVGDIGAAAKVNPPIREEWHQRQLDRALRDGTIDFLASDHAPHTAEQKRVDILKSPAGLSGIDTIGPLALDAYLQGQLDAPTLLRIVCQGAAHLFKLDGRKGSLTPGADADLVVVDPRATTEVAEDWMWSKAKQTPFGGRRLKGRITRVVVSGEEHFRDGQLVGRSGVRSVHQTVAS